MAVMERYALPHADYYHWCGPNAGGYVLEADSAAWRASRTLPLVGTVQYLKQEGGSMIGAAVLCGFLLDLLLGDPEWMPHPVVFMGKAITALEKRLRKAFPATPQGERAAAGRCWPPSCPWGRCSSAGGLCWLCWLIHPLLGFALQSFWCWQALAMRCLAQESRNVYRCLTSQGLPAARKAVARIVGRDTEQLTEEGVTRAAVETVAENFSDGELAPLLYMLIGGAPLALT